MINLCFTNKFEGFDLRHLWNTEIFFDHQSLNLFALNLSSLALRDNIIITQICVINISFLESNQVLAFLLLSFITFLAISLQSHHWQIAKHIIVPFFRALDFFNFQFKIICYLLLVCITFPIAKINRGVQELWLNIEFLLFYLADPLRSPSFYLFFLFLCQFRIFKATLFNFLILNFAQIFQSKVLCFSFLQATAAHSQAIMSYCFESKTLNYIINLHLRRWQGYKIQQYMKTQEVCIQRSRTIVIYFMININNPSITNPLIYLQSLNSNKMQPTEGKLNIEIQSQNFNQSQQSQNNNNNKSVGVSYQNQFIYDNPREIQEESEGQEPQYKVDKMLPKTTQKEKLIQQNIKLKAQIYQLAKQLDQILIKDKNRKKKYGISQDDDDETIRAKKLQLKKQQLQIMEIKNKIFVVKRQLQSVFNNRQVMAKQDQLKHLKAELKNLESEKDGLVKIKKQQTKALKVLRNEQEYLERIQTLKKQLNKTKEESRTLTEKLIQAQRILRKNHEQYILKQAKVKQLEQKLAANKQKAKNRKPVQTITPEMISELEDEIAELEKQRKQGEKLWQDKIRAIDGELHQKRMQQQKKLLILKQKEKQLKLNELRIKELRKLIRHNAVVGSTNQTAKKSQDADMSQYRHRRNIRYLDK